MAEAAISFLLQNLKEVVDRHIKLSGEAKHELKRLEKQMKGMKDYLTEVERKSTREFGNWESMILEAVYEAEDLIDSYVTQEEMAQAKTTRLNTGKVDLVIQMKQLLVELQSTFKSAQSQLAQLPTSDESTARIKRFRQVNPLVEKIVVGMKDEIEKLVADLLKSSSGVEAISITGMAGLGKSTIASAIYSDPRVTHHFPTRIWVNVSEDYKPREIYLNIVKKFTDRDMSKLEDSALVMLAHKHLSDVKFLLIMDDVWTAEAWNDIKQALPINQGSGKVLVTSRNDNMAAHVNRRREVNRLRFLTSTESWSLLQLEVYGKEGDWPKDSEEIGKKISEKCGGLPLAIVVIGGILVGKLQQEDTRQDEWRRVLESAEIELFKGKDDMVTSVKHIIGVSYYKMPYCLRHCFLYLGVCPRDFEISTWKLIRLWIAEGFIEDEGDPNKSLQDIAEEYLKELIRRNLVMVGKKNVRGNIKTCRVHDVIREFCKNEASNLLKVIFISKSLSTVAFHPDISEIRNFRRICVHSHVKDLLERKLDGPHVRSFICLSKHVVGAGTNTLRSVIEAFKLLRVFEGSSIRFPKYDPKITQLIHLRYITLATGEDFDALPYAFGQLLNVQTIVISTSKRTFEIRANIFEMTRLRHLKTKAAVILKLEKKYWGNRNGVNEKLHTLSNLSTQSCTMETLVKAPSLQTLGISGDINPLCNVRGLEKLGYLKRLKVTNFESLETPISQLLEERHFPPNLEILTLSATNLDWRYMGTLGRLKLKVLKLKDNAFDGDDWEVAQGQFGSLEHLVIKRSNLISWTMKEGCLENLKSLSLHTCEKLLAVPLSLAKSLKTLEMENVSANAVHSAKVIKERSGDVGAFSLILAPGTYVPT